MSRFRQICLISFALLAAGGCSEDPEPWHETSFETCDGEQVIVRVSPDLIPIGSRPNTIRRFGDDAWITVSGDNAVAHFDGASVTTPIDVGQDRNPYDTWADGDQVWIANLDSNTVSVFDRQTGAMREIEDARFDGPSAIVGNDTTVFVSNIAFRGNSQYDTGSVVAIDRNTFEIVARSETKGSNPQFLALTDDQKSLVVVNSGPFIFRDGEAFASDASTELWQLDTEAGFANQERFELPVSEDERIGSPGEVIQVGSTLYFTSGTGPVLFAFDLQQREWLSDASNPIVLYESDGNALNRATLHRGLIWNSAFNSDELVVFDPSCKKTVGTIPIERSELLAGPFGTVFFRDEVDFGYTILSNANSMARFEVVFGNRN